MKLYLAGPMRGYEKFNFPAFLEAAKELREHGHEILSPAELDLAENADAMDLPANDAEANFRVYMKRDLVAVLNCEGVALLPGWQHSTGAIMESIVSRLAGGKLFEYNEDRIDPLEPMIPLAHTVAVVKKLGITSWMLA